MKKLKLIISIISVFIIALALNYMTSIKEGKWPLSYYITDETEAISYDNINAQVKQGYIDMAKEMKTKLEGMNKKLYTEEEYALYEKFYDAYFKLSEEITDISMLVENNNYEKISKIDELKAVFIVNFENSFAKLYLKKYFEKVENGIYLLKDKEAVSKLIKSLEKSLNGKITKNEIEEVKNFLQNMEIVVKEVGGRYVFAFDRGYLNEYVNKISEKNAGNSLALKFEELASDDKLSLILIDTQKIIDRYKKLVDFKGYIDNLDYVYGYSEYKDGMFDITLSAKGAGKVFSILDSSALTERKLTNYLNENFNVYFANNSFENLFREINNEIIKIKGVDYSFFASMMIGGDPFAMINNLGDELVVNINDSKIGVVVNTKEPEVIVDLLEKVGVPNENGIYQIKDMTLELKENKAFFNQDTSTVSNNIDFNNLSFYTKFDFDYLVNNFPQFAELKNLGIEFITPEMFVYGKKDELSIKLKTDYNEFMNYIISTSSVLGNTGN